MGARLTKISNIKAFTELREARFQGNLLIETSINNILIDLDNNGQLNGSCRLDNGNAEPTGSGLIAKGNLELKGWLVTTN
jgi:hypothetical protein